MFGQFKKQVGLGTVTASSLIPSFKGVISFSSPSQPAISQSPARHQTRSFSAPEISSSFERRQARDPRTLGL